MFLLFFSLANLEPNVWFKTIFLDSYRGFVFVWFFTPGSSGRIVINFVQVVNVFLSFFDS